MDQKPETIIGIEIKTIREQKGLHQKDVIAKYKAMFNENLSQARLSSYETGKRTASLDTLLKIAEVLETELHLDHLTNVSSVKWGNSRSASSTTYMTIPQSVIPLTDSPSYYHPLISYLDSEDIGVDVCRDDESKIEIKLTPSKGESVTYTKKEFEALNRSVKEFIEFQLYKKSNK